MRLLINLALKMDCVYIYRTFFDYDELVSCVSDIYDNDDDYRENDVIFIHKIVMSDIVNYVLSKKELPLNLIYKHL